MTTIRRQDSVDVAPLSYSSDGSIDQSQVELSELRVKLKGSNNIGWEGQLILVASSRIKNLGNQLSHGGAVVS
jgi:hypothetical protein